MLTGLTTVPLHALGRSSLNARHTDPSVDIAGLADDIALRGLIHNLVAVPSIEPDRFDVVAGNRRLQALLLLAARGAIAGDYPVPIRIAEDGDGREISLAENVNRVPMNPVDEFEVFAALIAEAEGTPEERVEAVARRQQTTTRHVAQRLRLAQLAPAILEALRVGTIGLEAAKAYAGFSDLELQLKVYRAEDQRTWGTKHSPREVRNSLRMKTYPATVPQLAYVGLDAYLAAGGRAEADMWLFAEEGERLLDPSLLDDLARSKAMAEAKERATNEGYAGALLVENFSTAAAWPKAPAGFRVGFHAGDPRAGTIARGATIVLYRLAQDGIGLEEHGWYLADAPPPTAPGARTSASPPAAPIAVLAAEIASGPDRTRADLIRFRAARLAAPHVLPIAAAAPQVIWPDRHAYMRAIEEQADGSVLVAVQIRVTREELDAQRDAAEREIEA